ncbi:MAG: hypothetical protein RL431_713 [Actinomycetota bacterium]|jgi:hypothetical protein
MSTVVSRIRAAARVATTVALIGAVSGLTVIPATAAGAAATPGASSMGIVLPILSEPSDQLMTQAELIEATSATGEFTALADLAVEYDVTVAVDSRILASIEALGDSVPDAVADWKTTIVTESHLIVLPWANADPMLLISTQPTDRIGADELAQLSGQATSEITGWVSGAAIPEGAASKLAGLGYSTLLIDDTEYTGTRQVLSTAATDRASEAVSHESTTNITQTARALIAAGRSGSIWFALDSDTLDVARVRALLRIIDGNEQVTLTPVVPLTVADIGRDLAFHKFEHQKTLNTIFTRLRRDRAFSTIGADPTVLLYPRLRHVAAISSEGNSSDFVSVGTEYKLGSNEAERQIRIVEASAYTILASQTAFPVTVVNDSNTDVTVNLKARSKSAIVTVSQPSQLVTISAHSSTRVTVPLQVVSNGSTELTMKLQTPAGVPMGSVTRFDISASAQWETLTIVSFGAVVVTVLALGVLRTIRRRRDNR